MRSPRDVYFLKHNKTISNLLQLQGECDEWAKPAFVTKGLISAGEISISMKDEEIDEDEDDPAEDEDFCNHEVCHDHVQTQRQ